MAQCRDLAIGQELEGQPGPGCLEDLRAVPQAADDGPGRRGIQHGQAAAGAGYAGDGGELFSPLVPTGRPDGENTHVGALQTVARQQVRRESR